MKRVNTKQTPINEESVLIEKKIKEVQDYFKSKLLNGDFEVTNKTQYTITVLVDENYTFEIWVGNFNIVDSVCVHIEFTKTFMDVPMNKHERIKFRSIMKPYKEDSSDEIIAKKEAELKKIQDEIQKLKSC